MDCNLGARGRAKWGVLRPRAVYNSETIKNIQEIAFLEAALGNKRGLRLRQQIFGCAASRAGRSVARAAGLRNLSLQKGFFKANNVVKFKKNEI